ncbi:MAG: hypothetical protein ACKOGE_08530, partial [Actinomycetota bacterium]
EVETMTAGGAMSKSDAFEDISRRTGRRSGTTVTLPTFPLHYGELSIRGSYHHTPDAVREALARLAAGDAPYDELIGEEIGLDEVADVLRAGSGEKRPVRTAPGEFAP